MLPILFVGLEELPPVTDPELGTLPSLANSSSPGERLGAVAILVEMPQSHL